MAKGSGRLVSLDIFRGITIAFMIIVNTPGSWQFVYPPLRHAEWHGCTPTDMVFPFFLFIVGISAYYSMKKYGNELNSESVLRILRRTLLIFAAGLFLNAFPFFGRDYSALRIMGVLQRIAIAYGIGSFICLVVRRQYLWITVAFILLAYWALLWFFGGSDPYALETNFARRVDIFLLGEKHIYKGFGIPFEPEGLLSTIPAVCTVIIGYFTGELIAANKASFSTALKMILLGAASAGAGYLWGILFPVNKPLWTSSYVLYSAGFGMIVLALIYIVADVLELRKWGTFFLVFGTNSLFAFFIAGIWTKLMLLIKISLNGEKVSLYNWIYQRLCVPLAGNLNGSLMFALLQMLLVWSLALILYRKKIMIRL